VSKKPTYW